MLLYLMYDFEERRDKLIYILKNERFICDSGVILGVKDNKAQLREVKTPMMRLSSQKDSKKLDEVWSSAHEGITLIKFGRAVFFFFFLQKQEKM